MRRWCMSKTRHHDQYKTTIVTRGQKGSEHAGTCPLCQVPASTCIHCLHCGNAVCGCSNDDAWYIRHASKASTRALDAARLTTLIERLAKGWVEMSDDEVFRIANTIVIIAAQRVTSHETLPPCESGHRHDYLLHLEHVWGQLRAGRASWADLWNAADAVSNFFDLRDGMDAGWAFPLYEFDDACDPVVDSEA